MKVHTLEPISIGGNRIEAGCEAEVTAMEYVPLSKANAVEPWEVYEAKLAATRASAKAKADAEEIAAKADAEAKATAARLSAEAMAKADGERKTDARVRAERAKPAPSA